MFDRALRPEWLDYALDQSVRIPDDAQQRQALREYLGPQIKGVEALAKTITQLQRIVGPNSPVPREQVCAHHELMSQLAPDQRASIRLSLMIKASPFFSDTVTMICKLEMLSSNGFTTAQIIERLTAKYGDRAVVPRAGRRVLQTLLLLGMLQKKDRHWNSTNLK